MNDIVAFVESLNLDTAASGRLLNQLTDIENRKVKPLMVESYCKSLGWDGVPERYSELLAWREFQNQVEENSVAVPESADAEDTISESIKAVRRALISLATSANNGSVDPAFNDMTIEALYDYVVDAMHPDHTSEVSFAVNNLMVRFLRAAGLSDIELSEMSLNAMASAIDSRMQLIGQIATVLNR